VQEAVYVALDELNTDESNVDVEVIDEGNKGIFGLIGNKMAKVRVTLRESKGKKLENSCSMFSVK
jgi:spoIIIJ-associated protein